MRISYLFLLSLLALTGPTWADPVDPVLRYIEEGWDSLRRGPEQLAQAAVDPKLGELERWPVYVAASEYDKVASSLSQAQLAEIELRPLPEDGELEQHGLLYLPHPYVVPGGRFNEMYGWDSYFINVGLLQAGRVDEARLMTENHLYQVRHYGKVLNANRTYYLNRSQPPFLASMVADVHRLTGDEKWLEQAWPELLSTYEFWTSEPHLVPGTGLSRYYSTGKGPAPEVVEGEKDEQGRTHYDRIKSAYAKAGDNLGYELELYYKNGELTDLFYIGDRTMRESGFDPSDRFGRFNVDVIHYLPVDLNSLLYDYELQMARLAKILGRDGEVWLERAGQRRVAIAKYLWNEKEGLFFDYNFRTQKQRIYPFATTFFPLWVRAVEPEVAARVSARLDTFERDGGVVTSTYRSGNQWDEPFGWAPLQMVAVDGLRRYGYHRQADRVACKFLSLILEDFAGSGTIVEKYDVVARSSRVSEGIEFGYDSNEIGFGWTNAVFLKLWNDLPKTVQQRLRSHNV